MAWDMRYRPLREGEAIRMADEVQQDDGSWRFASINCVGQPAPNPNYTSHRVYRRLVAGVRKMATYHEHKISDLQMSGTYHPGDDV